MQRRLAAILAAILAAEADLRLLIDGLKEAGLSVSGTEA